MNPVTVVRTALVIVFLAAPSSRAMVYLRTMPEEGTWAEWRIDSSLPSPGVELKIRMTAGKIADRDGRKFQTLVLEMPGTWEVPGAPFPFKKATYEIDLEQLKTDGHADGAAKIVEAWIAQDGQLKKLSMQEQAMMMHKVMFYRLSDITVEDDPVKPVEPHPAAYSIRLLKAKAHTRHYGSGQAPKSEFKAWISDEIPFGVAKWQVKTELPMDRRETATVTIEATIRGIGKIASSSSAADGDRNPIVVRSSSPASHPVKAIAVFPDESYLSDAIAGWLNKRGYTGLLHHQLHHLLTPDRYQKKERNMVDPEQLKRFREGGVDAIIVMPYPPEGNRTSVNISAQLISAHDRTVLGDVVWREAHYRATEGGDKADLDKLYHDSSKDITDALLECAGLK